MDHDRPIMELRKFIREKILHPMSFRCSPSIGLLSFYNSAPEEISDNENCIFGLKEILQNQNYMKKYTVDDLRCIVEVAVNNGILEPWDLADINDYYEMCLKSAARPVRCHVLNPLTKDSSYSKCLVRELRSERKRSKTIADKLSEWESHGKCHFTKDDLEFRRNDVKIEGRNHISKVQKVIVVTPLKYLRGGVVAKEETFDFKLCRGKAELAAFVSEKDDLESKVGNDAETRGRLEELDRMIVETRDRVALLEGLSIQHNLCIFGGLQPFNVDGGMRSRDLDKFGGVREPSTSVGGKSEPSTFVGGKFMSPTYLDKFESDPEPSSFGGKFMSPTYLDKFESDPEPSSFGGKFMSPTHLDKSTFVGGTHIDKSTFVGGKFMSPTYMDKFGGVPGPSTSVGGKFLSSSYLDKFGGAPNVVGDEVTSAIDLSNLGVPEQATSLRGQNQSADDLRNFEVQEDADYRED
ncbi:hypothetical protein ACH5RR_007233 [Cinchona calisaya]|uniref:Uncharacterized protein n=1 Tax=Cinchona calisaya TaxID=153742 RepID=A0ABD3ARP4_9GENT